MSKEIVLRILLAIFIALELLLIAILSGHEFIRRREYDAAVVAAVKQPSPESGRELERQRQINAHIRVIDSSGVAALLALNTVGIVVVWRRLRRMPQLAEAVR